MFLRTTLYRKKHPRQAKHHRRKFHTKENRRGKRESAAAVLKQPLKLSPALALRYFSMPLSGLSFRSENNPVRTNRLRQSALPVAACTIPAPGIVHRAMLQSPISSLPLLETNGQISQSLKRIRSSSNLFGLPVLQFACILRVMPAVVV